MAKCLKPGLHKHNRGLHDVSHQHIKSKKSKPKESSQRLLFHCKAGTAKMLTMFKFMKKMSRSSTVHWSSDTSPMSLRHGIPRGRNPPDNSVRTIEETAQGHPNN